MTTDDIATAMRLLQRVAALLGATGFEVHAHGVSDDVIASMLIAGADISQISTGRHCAELAGPGKVQLNAYGKTREAVTP
jgi:hypothetical protein